MPIKPRPRVLFLVLPGAAALAIGALAPAAAAPAAPGAAAAAGARGPEIRGVEQLLKELEQADVGLRTLAADISYDRRLMLQGDRHVRQGKLFFRSEPSHEGAAPEGKGRRAFAIDFERLYIGGRRDDETQRWIFDGEWLAEIRPAQRQFVKRRIAPPDSDFDPLAIGEGPLPIPIGQKAADILARYDARLLGAPDGLADEESLVRFVEGSHQLRLIPKTGDPDEQEFEEIRLWYRWDEKAGRFLPRLAKTVNAAGDESFVQLVRVTVNGPVDASVFDIEAPADDSGWDVQIIDDLSPEEAPVDAAPKRAEPGAGG